MNNSTVKTQFCSKQIRLQNTANIKHFEDCYITTYKTGLRP